MKEEEDSKPGSRAHHYIFRCAQVLTGDVGGFIRQWDPERFTAQGLTRACGCLSLELEHVAKCGDAFTVPEARHLIRKLWNHFPWLGFYLAPDRPFGKPGTVGRFPFLAVGLCLTDVILIARDKTGQCELAVNQHQLREVRARYISGLEFAWNRTEIPAAGLDARAAEIDRQLGLLLNEER